MFSPLAAPSMGTTPTTHRSNLRLPRRPRNSPELLASKLPWVKSSGPQRTLFRRAALYLTIFDYKEAAKWELDTEIFLRVVCNVRMHYQQDADHTVKLILKYFHRHSWEVWSVAAIQLAWELVEPFTPTLGLADEDAISKRRMAELEDGVVDIIAFTRSGGRVTITDLYSCFKEWYPDIEVDIRVFGKVVKSVTGISSKPSNCDRYYYGFHLPTAKEQMDLKHGAQTHQSADFVLPASLANHPAA